MRIYRKIYGKIFVFELTRGELQKACDELYEDDLKKRQSNVNRLFLASEETL